MAGFADLVFSFFLFFILHYVDSSELTNMIDEDLLTTKAFVFWPNATIPFYIDNEHFDNEQSITIMTALSLFAFKTCLKFAPVMARPEDTDHVLLLENPTGVRKCTINTEPHSIEEPHRVTLGYDCLKSPEIDMMIMKALGFPFEHNRAVRDLYIEVQSENVEPGFLDLFTRDLRLPLELRAIPYDPNSVMHFGQRDFSKNGHRTIIFKNSNLRQERFGLSPLDLRKIDVVYGPECRIRDRQEKIELCQNYPGVARRKREAQSLRVNPDITPPPTAVNGTKVTVNFTDALVKDLGIEKELDELVEKVNHVAGVALVQAKSDKCDNKTKTALRTLVKIDDPNPEVLDIIGDVAKYAHNVVYTATKNLTEFCLEEKPIQEYLRSSCPFFNKDLCPKSYRSTKSGPVKYSTQHRPLIRQSTRPQALAKKHIYENWYRSGNNTEEPTATDVSPSDVSPSDVSPSDVSPSDASPTDVSPSDSNPKQDLRSGNTRLPTGNKSVYVPNYRASNDTNVKERKKRDTSKDTPKVPAEKLKDPKAAVVSKVKKSEEKMKSAKRRFESQRFSSQKGMYNREQQERQWDNSDVSVEKISRNDGNPTNDHSFGKGRIMDKRSRADDKDTNNDNGDPKNGNVEPKNEEMEPIFDVKKPIEEKGNEDNGKQPDNEALRAGKKRHRYDEKNYDYKETNYGPKKFKNEDSFENKRYDTRYDDEDRKTRFHKQESRYQDEDRYGGKDPKFNDKEPSYDERRPRYKEKGEDYSDERPIGKNRFKIRKPPQSKASGDTGGGGQGSRISDEKDEDYLSKHGRDGKIKSRVSAETYYHDIHDGVSDDGKVNVKRPRVSDDEEEKETDMQYRDTESPLPKKPAPNKKGKRHPKQHSQKSAPPAHSEEHHPQRTGGLPRVLKLDKKNKEFYEERMWPDGVVRYVIKDPGDVDLADVRARLNEVNQILKRKTCARLEELTEEEADSYEDYLVLDNSPDYVTGRVGGRQVYGVVELLKGGQHRQHAAMMVMAMLGFYFEISRHDRDKYIRVHMRHIRPDKLHHFEKVREDATFPLPYDYKSATHPAWQFWRQIGRTGISTVATFKQQDPDGSIMKSLGQNKELLSELDIVKINSVYGIECFMPKDRQRDDRGGERQEEGEEEREDKKSDVSHRDDNDE